MNNPSETPDPVQIAKETLRRLIQESGDPETSTSEEALQELGPEFNALRAEAVEDFIEHSVDRWGEIDSSLESFRERLYQTWGGAIETLEVCLMQAIELSDEFAESERPHGGQKIDALTRLHARGCQIAREICWLLRGGFSSAALARWRTLYEVTVVGMLLAQEDDELSRRYLAYDAIESYKAMLAYERGWERLGFEPPTPEEKQAIIERQEDQIAEFGERFGKPYGWAASVLDDRHLTFECLERALDFDHWRTYYKLSSNGIHAGPKGILYTFEQGYKPEILLRGPSNRGLDDPGQCTAITLGQLTTSVLAAKPTLERVVGLDLLNKLVGAAVRAFTEGIAAQDPG